MRPMMVMMLVACFGGVTVRADERADLIRELEALEVRIVALEAADEPVPDELREAAEELEEAIDELAEMQGVIADTLAAVEEIHAPAAEWLRTLRTRDEDAFRHTVEELYHALEELEELEDDPERQALERDGLRLQLQANYLAVRFRDVEAEARERISDELRSVLTKLFQVRLEARRLSIKRLEAELAEARERLEEMNQRKREMIERRLRTMLYPDEAW